MSLEHTKLGHHLDSLTGPIADWALESLLKAMSYAFEISDDVLLARIIGLEGYKANIDGFEAVYGFESKDGAVQATAAFKDGIMQVKPDAPNKWELKVTFTDAPAFWKFIFSGGNDILQALLANDVEVYGNVNYLYKFGFMARDLKERLNLP